MYQYDLKRKKILYAGEPLSKKQVLEHLNEMYAALNACSYAYGYLEAAGRTMYPFFSLPEIVSDGTTSENASESSPEAISDEVASEVGTD